MRGNRGMKLCKLRQQGGMKSCSKRIECSKASTTAGATVWPITQPPVSSPPLVIREGKQAVSNKPSSSTPVIQDEEKGKGLLPTPNRGYEKYEGNQ